MAGAGGLAVILLAGFAGLVLLSVTAILIIYGLLTRHWLRGFIASLIAFGFTIVAALLSAPIWLQVLSGYGTHGESFDASDIQNAWMFVATMALALLLSLIAGLRQLARKRRPA